MPSRNSKRKLQKMLKKKENDKDEIMLKHVLPVYNSAQKASLSPPPPSPSLPPDPPMLTWN